jgi:hypothetical protein
MSSEVISALRLSRFIQKVYIAIQVDSTEEVWYICY